MWTLSRLRLLLAASFMILASFGVYVPIFGHDHEAAVAAP
jgi:hypothetical protein